MFGVVQLVIRERRRQGGRGETTDVREIVVDVGTNVFGGAGMTRPTR